MGILDWKVPANTQYLPPPYNWALVRSSCSFIVVTSINHWRFPMNGLRRDMDIIVSTSVCLGHTLQVLSLPLPGRLFFISYIGFLTYAFSRACVAPSHQEDVKWHRRSHLLFSLGAICLYGVLHNPSAAARA